MDDPERWVDQLTQERLSKLGNDPPDARMIGEDVHPLEDLGDEPVADLGDPFFGVPRLAPRVMAP